jgi:hypothetical protein
MKHHRRRWAHCMLAIVMLCLASGCQAPAPSPPKPLPPGSTYLLHLPGIMGDTPFDHWWIDALKEGGAADRVQLFDWTCHDPWIDALLAYDRNHIEATKVARLIAGRRRADPTGKLILTAESGGAGILVWALERLPKNVQVDDVLMIAPAVSPGYDLSLALRHVRGKAYYFDSPGDVFMLGFGTRLFGTMDGKKTDAAGLAGFHPPPHSDPAEYKKLVEIRYDPAWWLWGNFGGHTGGMSVTFAQKYLAPLLVRAERALVARDVRLPAGKSAAHSALSQSSRQRQNPGL